MKTQLQKLLSYFSEVTVKTVKLQSVPVAKVVLSRGKYILDGQRVNYAFGGLDTFFRHVFNSEGIPSAKMQKALVLGFGAGNVATILREKNPEIHITGVEPDEKIVELAREYFYHDWSNVEMVTDTAENFLKKTSQTFDLIVVDVFVEELVPKPMQTTNAIKNLVKALSPGGVLLFNQMAHSNKLKAGAEKFGKIFCELFPGARLRQIRANLPLIYQKP